MQKNQNGSAVVVVLTLIGVLCVLGLVGWSAYSYYANGNDAAVVQYGNEQTIQNTSNQSSEIADKNEGYLVVREWGLRFKVPAGISDVHYEINGDVLGFFAKPSGLNIEYREDYKAFKDRGFTYALGVLYRSSSEYNNEGVPPVKGKKIGSNYYHTAWAFSSIATGSGCKGIYGEEYSKCDIEAKAFPLINQGKSALLNTIELAQ